MMIAYDITSASRVGCVRRQNEDMILIIAMFAMVIMRLR